MLIQLFRVLHNCENAFCLAWVKYVDIVREIFSTADETGYDNNQLWIKTIYTSRISKIEFPEKELGQDTDNRKKPLNSLNGHIIWPRFKKISKGYSYL